MPKIMLLQWMIEYSNLRISTSALNCKGFDMI